MYITRGPKILTYNLVWVHQKKNQIQQRSHSNWGLSSHCPLDYVDRSEIFSNSSFISGRKLDAGYGTFCPSQQKTEIAGWWDTTYTFMWVKFYCPTDF